MRKEIKQVAESQFITRGYDGTTMRSIAKGAGCDPAMVSYYFGSKQRLFRDCFDLPLDPLEQILQLWEPGIEGIADRLLDFFAHLSACSPRSSSVSSRSSFRL